MAQVSIVIPLYNKQNHILETLQSVFAQSFTDFEVIVVNDGSTDGSRQKVETLVDSRIRLFNIPNRGVSAARNYGIKQSNSPWIAFLDADDYWFPHHLEDLLHLAQAFSDCGLYAKAYYKEMNGRKIPPVFVDIPENPWRGVVKDYFNSSSGHALAWTSAVMIPQKVLEEMGGFDEKITFGAGEDTDLWMRIALKYPVAFDNKISAIHKLHADNRISNSNTNKRQFIDLDQYNALAENHPSLRKYLDLNRYAIAMQYRLVGNQEKAEEYIRKIDKQNLTQKQRNLLHQPIFVLRLFYSFKNILLKLGIHLSAFK